MSSLPATQDAEKVKPWEQFTANEQRFVEAYMMNRYNPTEAWISAGYSTVATRPSLRANAHQVLRRPHVKAEINRRMRDLVMSQDEALARHSGVGRADIGECLVDHEIACPSCGHIIEEAGTLRLDLKLLKEKGQTHLIKKLTPFKDGRIAIELYESDKARQDIMKAQGVFRTPLEDVTMSFGALMAAAAAAKRDQREPAIEVEYEIEDGETS